jgi:hypothetical protein
MIFLAISSFYRVSLVLAKKLVNGFRTYRYHADSDTCSENIVGAFYSLFW